MTTSKFINETLLQNEKTKQLFSKFPVDSQIAVLIQADRWDTISKMKLSVSQIKRFSKNILWHIAIHYNNNIPLDCIVIKKRSVALYVAFNYYNLPKELVKRKFLRNNSFHDVVQAVAIWYSSPDCRQMLETFFKKEDLFNIENYTSFTMVRHKDAIYDNISAIKQYSNNLFIPRILFESKNDMNLSINTGGWFNCFNCSKDRDGCKHFPTLKYIQNNNVCTCGKIH